MSGWPGLSGRFGELNVEAIRCRQSIEVRKIPRPPLHGIAVQHSPLTVEPVSDLPAINDAKNGEIVNNIVGSCFGRLIDSNIREVFSGRQGQTIYLGGQFMAPRLQIYAVILINRDQDSHAISSGVFQLDVAQGSVKRPEYLEVD